MSTKGNLKTAFAGESQANQKYLAYAEKATRDGYPVVAKLFRAVAAAEAIHARNHLKALEGIKTTLENLTDAQGGEDYEITEMYPPMIAAAEAEGDKRASRSMHYALEVEKVHYELYGTAIAAVTEGKDLGNVTAHVCPICGHTVLGDAPDNCPVCGCAGKSYIEIA
ncbi:rubrerythrin [Rhizomicrobium palustre]|jgi:rubrerythrin|uniref:Rubrerythrin n=1 Tax=Rhizomicrobium palustre TaxID=189966 RepID=A0A846N1G5_9PROT|nr:rubrerythrin family protein [Rhizomicrobium palustre]NIK88997.1 rubrerythrin [Rhizomicrobium palustre]